METRLLIAYLLIALLVLAAGLLARHLVHKQQERRKVTRGRGSHRKKV